MSTLRLAWKYLVARPLLTTLVPITPFLNPHMTMMLTAFHHTLKVLIRTLTP